MGGGEGKEQEEEGADEFAAAGYEVIASGVVEAIGKGQSAGVGLRFFHDDSL